MLGLLGALLYYLGERAGLIYATQARARSCARLPARLSVLQPVVYSFQLLIPGLDLRQATYWWPDSSRPRGGSC